MFDPYTYRCPAGHPDPCPVCTGAPHLEEILQYEGAHTVAAVILETVTGTNGIIVPPDGYLQSIREVCDRHGILLIADEVMAGFGRTGKWFAVDNWDVVPDILTSRRASTPATSRSARWSCASRSPTGCATRSSPAGSPTAAIRSRARRPSRRSRPSRRRASSSTSAAMGEVFRAELAKLAGEAPVDRRGARPRLLLGPRARQEPRDARAARPVQRLGRGGEAGGGADEARARPRPLPDDALERRHVSARR